jgi:TM2 domain-containing membrane protein YozV
MKDQIMAIDIQQQILIEQRVANEGKSEVIAYLLLIFFWPFGAHRFYLGRITSGLIMLALSLTIIGLPIVLIWSLVDLFLIPAIVRERRDELRENLARTAQI